MMTLKKTLLFAGILGLGLAGSHAAKADWHHDGGWQGAGDGYRHDDDHWRHQRGWVGGYYPPPPPVYYAPGYYPPPPAYYPPPPPVYYAPPPVYYAPPPLITFGFRP